MKRDAVLNLRVPAEMKSALERAAEDDFRSVSSLAVLLLMESLMQRGYIKPVKKKGKG
jgi:hypothetical protein